MTTPNPIAAVVEPLKADAIQSTEQSARSMVAEYLSRLETAGWDLNIAFPRPVAGRVSDAKYMKMRRHRDLASRFTSSAREFGPTRESDLRVRNDDGIERWVEACKQTAANDFDSFVAKLAQKIGQCETATLLGNFVWSHSILTVAKADGSVESWKTQQIVNVSKFGLLFNQWPTRKLGKKG